MAIVTALLSELMLLNTVDSSIQSAVLLKIT